MGFNIGGAVTGAVSGFMVGGPAGAVVGAGVGGFAAGAAGGTTGAGAAGAGGASPLPGRGDSIEGSTLDFGNDQIIHSETIEAPNPDSYLGNLLNTLNGGSAWNGGAPVSAGGIYAINSDTPIAAATRTAAGLPWVKLAAIGAAGLVGFLVWRKFRGH